MKCVDCKYFKDYGTILGGCKLRDNARLRYDDHCKQFQLRDGLEYYKLKK